MKTSKEIKNVVVNLQYYAKQVEELARKQMAEDVALGNELGINVNSGTLRFDCLGAIGSASNWIETYCQNILSNLAVAEEQDKVLYKPEPEPEVVTEEQERYA